MADIVQGTPAAHTLAREPRFLPLLDDVLRTAADSIAQVVPEVAPWLAARAHTTDLDGAAATLEAVERLEAAGVELVAPERLTRRRPTTRGTVQPRTEAGAGIAVHLLALQVVLIGGVTLFYGRPPAGPLLLVVTCLAATVGLAAVGSIYGALSAGMRMSNTLLPLLVLPIVAPVLIAATEAFAAAYEHASGEGWRWFGLLAVFATLYLAIGIFAFDQLLEES